MRKLYLLSTLLLFTFGVHSQVIFEETFDNIPGNTSGGSGTYAFPSGWTLADVDEQVPSANVSYVNDAWERREDFVNNVLDSVAFSTSWYTPVGQADDWMWTPPITLPSTTQPLTLSWNALAYDPSFRDGYEVRIMTVAPTGTAGNLGNMVSASDVLLSIAEENSNWTARDLSLNAYAGNTVYIGFRNNTNDQFLLLIDDVTVTGESNPVAVCNNTTVQLDATGSVTIVPSDIDGGSSDADGPVTLSIDITSFDCSNIGDNTVTLTATDEDGNTNTCTATVTVKDTVDPTITCTEDITVSNDPGVCEANITIPIPPFSDNCSGLNTTGLQFDGTNDYVNFPLPTVFTDITNNDFTIEMWVNPTNTGVIQRLFFAQENATNFTSLLLSPSNQLYFYVNNTVSALINSTLVFNTWSHITARWNAVTQTPEIFINGVLQAVVNGGTSSTGTDNTMTLGSRTDGAQVFTGTIDEVRIWNTARSEADILNNYEGCVDTSNPNLGAYYQLDDGTGSTIVSDATGNGFNGTLVNMDATTAWIAGQVECNPIITLVNDYNNSADASDVYPVGTTTVTWTATDISGNTATCSFDVTVNDTEAPTANCAAPFTVQLDANGEASITAADIENGSTDNCGIDTTSIDITDFDCSNVGDNTVTLTVTDNAGNTSTCTTTVTVEDTIAPVANCVAPFTIQLDANGQVSITAADIENGSTDNCGVDTTSIDITDFDCSNIGDNTVTLTVTDTSGNSSTCTTTVTVEDNVAPVANCVAPFTVQLDANGQASITVADIENGSTDACGVDTTSIDITDFDCSNIGDNTVTLTVTDTSGNSSTCTTIVTVEDTIAPTIACAMDTMASTDPGDCFATVTFPDALATDNCSGVTVAQTDGLPSGSQFPVGVSTVEFTATDASGNTSVCTFDITVEDNEAPIAVCENITIQLDEFGAASITAADLDGGSTDACGVDTIAIDQDTFDCSNVGDNNVTLTVTDVNGNVSTCTAIVTVEDVTAPEVVCQDITVQLDATGTISITGMDVDGGSTDACGIASYDLDMDTFDCSNVGVNTVELTVTDNNGNTATCTAMVTVEDNTSPDLVCTDFTLELGEDGTATLLPGDVIASNDDACGIDTTAVDITEFDCSDIGTPVTVQVFVSDVNGNLSTCNAVVTVVDALAPVVTCPADQTVDPGEGSLFYEVPDYFALGEASATDNCTNPVTITSQEPAAGELLSDGIYTITLNAEDDNGNIGTCTFELTVESILGVGGTDSLGSVQLYPNPANKQVTLGNPSQVNLKEAIIYDLTGRVIRTINLTGMGAQKTINVTNLSSATYLVRISSENGTITKQLIKE